jgi:outer membrane protein TolC
MRQKLGHSIVRAYYSAALGTEAIKKVEGLLRVFEERQKTIRMQLEKKRISKYDGLKSEEAIVRLRLRLEEFRRQQGRAMMELATAIGYAPNAVLQFPATAPVDSSMEYDIAALELEALQNRPELSEQDLQGAIAADDVKVQMLSMLPSISGFLGGHYDSNKFLRHSTWVEAGARVSWDLLSLPSRWSNAKKAEITTDLIRQRRLALSAAVLTQVHLAVLEHADAVRRYRLSQDLAAIMVRKLVAAKSLQKQKQISIGEVMRTEAETLFAELSLLGAHGDLAVARHRVITSVGRTHHQPS